jgi:glutamate/tyrosine decarboxylase-like PLP-dependent enzyme
VRGIAALPGVEIVGEPIGPVLALRSDSIDLYAVGDVMDDKGWHLNRNTEPRGLHLMLSPAHAGRAEALLADLADAVAHHGESKGGRGIHSCDELPGRIRARQATLCCYVARLVAGERGGRT